MPRKTRRCQPAREIYCAITLTPASSVSRPAKASMPITPNPNRRTDRPAGPALSLEPPGGTPAHQHRTGTPDPRRDEGTAPPRCRPICPRQGDAVRTFRRLCVAPADAWSSPTEKVSHDGQQHGRHDRDQKHRDQRDVDPHVFAFDPDITGKVTEPSESQGPQQMPTATMTTPAITMNGPTFDGRRHARQQSVSRRRPSRADGMPRSPAPDRPRW